MPKIKTIHAISKRVKKLSSGKLKFKQTNLRHILTKKKKKRKRQLRGKKIVNKINNKLIIKGIPYL